MKIIRHIDLWAMITPNLPEEGKNWRYGLCAIWYGVAFILVSILMLPLAFYNLVAWGAQDIKLEGGS